MSAAWQRNEEYDGDMEHDDDGLVHIQLRSSLGQFIERSTSAPLPSSSFEDYHKSHHGDSLVGNDLLEQLSKGYSDYMHQPGPVPSGEDGPGPHLGATAFRELASAADFILGQPDTQSGRSSIIQNSHPMSSLQQNMVRPGSAHELNRRGRSTSGGGPGAVVLDGGELDCGGALLGEPSTIAGLDFERLGTSILRSRSAQPALYEGSSSSIRPPPGLASDRRPTTTSPHPETTILSATNSGTTAASHSSIGLGIKRPASTGVIGTSQANAALRPAAKTLMDLIQEDFPEDIQGSPHYEGQMDRQTPSPAAMRQAREYGAFSQSSSPYLQQTAARRNVQLTNQSNYVSYERGPSVVDMAVPSTGSHRFQESPQAQQHPQQTRFYVHEMGRPQTSPEGFLSMQQPSSSNQPHASRQAHRYGNDLARRHSPVDEPLQVYSSILQGQQTMGQHGEQIPLYYNAAPAPQHRVDPGIAVHHVMPTGQTLYVSAPAPQSGYSYATIPYQPGQQQPMAPQNISAGLQSQNDQYLSVLPIQNRGSHVTYWQTDQQHVVTPVTILSSTGSSHNAITMSRVSGETVPSGRSSVGGRNSKSGPGVTSERGGRGRRNMGSRRGDSKMSSYATACPILEEFRSAKARDWTIRHIEGNVLEFCQDQNGSRFIQQRLELGDPVEQQIVMKEVLPSIRRLRNDVFGNYVVQKLLDFGTSEMKAEIRDTLRGEMLQLSLQMYGCRVVQKALEALDEVDLPFILMEFRHNVLSCIHDQNGNHVIQKCVEVISGKARKSEASGDKAHAAYLRGQIDFIIDDVLVNTVTLSCHPYGCRVLQRILEHCDENKKILVLNEIQKCHQKLLDDQYGNYVIQHVLQFGRQIDRDSILKIIVQNGLLILSRQKFASNVVEKLLKHGNGEQRRAIAREMLKTVDSHIESRDAGKTVVLLMVRDAYANYVVQTTLDVIPDSEEKSMLIEELNVHADELKNYTFAKHIVTKLTSMNIGTENTA